MPAKNPRLTTVVEKSVHHWLKENARKRGVSISWLMRDILREAYEREEDMYLAREGEERLKTFNRREALTDEQVWGKAK
jgi:predicted DNA-binding protein